MSGMSDQHAREFTAERAAQAASHGMDWIRQLAEHGLDQSKVIFDSLVTATRGTAGTIDQQVSEIRERSLALVSHSLSNGFDFANRILRAKEPQEVLRLQSEFLSRQAQALADQAKELGQTMAHGVEDIGAQTFEHVQSATDAVRRKAQG
jgi:hypothetical protein